MVGSGQVIQVATFDGLGLTPLVLGEGDDLDLVRDRLDVILVSVWRQVQRPLGRNKSPVQIRQHVVGSGGRAVERRTVNRGDGGSMPPTAVSKLRQLRLPHICMCLLEETQKPLVPSIWCLCQGK